VLDVIVDLFQQTILSVDIIHIFLAYVTCCKVARPVSVKLIQAIFLFNEVDKTCEEDAWDEFNLVAPCVRNDVGQPLLPRKEPAMDVMEEHLPRKGVSEEER
jgi:hypothetical protein